MIACHSEARFSPNPPAGRAGNLSAPWTYIEKRFFACPPQAGFAQNDSETALSKTV